MTLSLIRKTASVYQGKIRAHNLPAPKPALNWLDDRTEIARSCRSPIYLFVFLPQFHELCTSLWGSFYHLPITCLHLAASECFNARNAVAGTLVESSHVIAVLCAVAPPLVIERKRHIFIVTVFITVGVTLWVATLCFVDVVQEMRCCFAQSETVHVITFRTQRPDILSSKKG